LITCVGTLLAEGAERVHVVELRGFEPLTSSMPWKRATNCAIAPLLGHQTDHRC
jgi:hypothetical protein